MFFSDKGSSKNRRKEKKRDRNIYGIFGRSDSDISDSGDEDRFKPILKDSDSSPDNYDSDDSDNFRKFKKSTNLSKYNKTKNNKNSSKNEKNAKKTDFLGFVSGGTLNLSQIDSSPPNTTKEHIFTEELHEDHNSDMELNSDEELLNKVIDYDDYVLVEEDEELLMEKRRQLQMEKRMREQYNSNFKSRSYREKQFEEQLPPDNGPLKEDKMKKIYGKGLNMLKKMGYKGGGLGREGKGLVNPLTFSSSKDNSSVYKIEELDKNERLSQTRLSQVGLTSDSIESQQLQSTGVSEGDRWLEWLNKRYNQSLSDKEEVEIKRRELNKLNLRLNDEIKLLNLEVQRKLQLLEDFERLKPRIESRYEELLEILNKVGGSTTTSGNAGNTTSDATTGGNNRDDNDNMDIDNNVIDELVDKLIKLLKLLNKVGYENKMNKVAVRLTFKNLFDSNFKSDICYNLKKYEKFFQSLPVINKYFCDLKRYSSGNAGNSSSNRDGNENEIQDLLNYYVINSLMEYYRNSWDPVNIDKGLNLYQYVHLHLSQFYGSNMDSRENNNTATSGNAGNSSASGNHYQKSIPNGHLSNDGLDVLLKEIVKRLVDYVKNLVDVKELYNCHIFVFPWLEYFNNDQIHKLVDVFMDTLFSNTGELIVWKCEGGFNYQNGTSSSNTTTSGNVGNSSSRDGNDNMDSKDNVERYENIYNNWNKLMADKKEFESRLYDKLYDQLSSVNTNLIFSLNVDFNEGSNSRDNTTTGSGNAGSRDGYGSNNRLNELLNLTLSWNKLVDDDTMVKLLSNTILAKFKQFLVQSISSLSRNYDEYHNNSSRNDNEGNKVLKLQREKIVEFYLYFKSLLPSYVNKNKNVQEYCFKVILNKMESFVNCYSNTGVENNTATSGNVGNSCSRDGYGSNRYNREYESEESSVSGDEDY